jgi:hypothetical protein
MKYDPSASAYGAQPVMNLGMSMQRNAGMPLPQFQGFGDYGAANVASYAAGRPVVMPQMPVLSQMQSYSPPGLQDQPMGYPMQAQPEPIATQLAAPPPGWGQAPQMPFKGAHYGMQASYGGPVQQAPAQPMQRKFF